MRNIILSVLLIIFITGCDNSKNNANNSNSQEIPIEVKVMQAYNQAYGFYYPKLIITSITDDVTVDKVIVNKGNCNFESNTDIIYVDGKVKGIPLLPRKLGYGDQFEIRLRKCNVLRVDVTTNKGDWTLNYNN